MTVSDKFLISYNSTTVALVTVCDKLFLSYKYLIDAFIMVCDKSFFLTNYILIEFSTNYFHFSVPMAAKLVKILSKMTDTVTRL